MTDVRQRKLPGNFGAEASHISPITNELDPNSKKKLNTEPIEHVESTTSLNTKVETAAHINAPKPERLVLFAFIVLGLLTRFFRISAGKYVLWDEAHFGKFGSHYLKRTFYFDVHPPLGKMLVGLAGYLAGYDGSFEFASGSDYISTVNYVGIRMFLACFSAFSVPFAYLTAVQLKFNQAACVLVGLMTLAGNKFV